MVNWDEILKFLFGATEKGLVDRVGLWAAVSAITTILVLYVGYRQLDRISATSAADFADRLKKAVFTKANLQLIALLSSDLLNVHHESDRYFFKIDNERLEKDNLANILGIKGEIRVGGIVPADQIDELLGQFENLGVFYYKGLIDSDTLYELFSAYIEEIWENPVIREYIRCSRQSSESADTFDWFEYLYGVCREIGSEKRSRPGPPKWEH